MIITEYVLTVRCLEQDGTAIQVDFTALSPYPDRVEIPDWCPL